MTSASGSRKAKATMAGWPIISQFLIKPARLLMTPEMFVPRVVKTPTTASAISAAATAYSESSSPLSSRRKLLIIALPSLFPSGSFSRRQQARPFTCAGEAGRARTCRDVARLLDVGGEVVDDALDVAAQRREDADDRSEEHTSELQSRLHLVCRL